MIPNLQRAAVWCFAAGLMTLPLVAGGHQNGPRSVGIDALVRRPRSYDGRVVKVRAFIKTDYRHFVVLLAAESADEGVALLIPESVRKDAAVADLMHAIYRRPPAGKRRQIQATLIGTFESHPDEVPSRVLSLRSVANLRVRDISGR